jgi:hypothetical protein
VIFFLLCCDAAMLRCVRELYVDANTHTRRDDTTLQKRIFPDAAASVAGGATVHVVVTFQPSRTDLIDWSDEAAQEKDVLLENVRDAVHSSQETPLMHSSSCLCVRVRGRAQFVEWGKGVCELLRKDGHWADLSDPCSGYPVRVSSLCRSLSLRSACMRVRVDMIVTARTCDRGTRKEREREERRRERPLTHRLCFALKVIGERGGMAYSDTSGIELLLPYDRIQVPPLPSPPQRHGTFKTHT